MLVAERYHKIVQLVNERGSIRVTELSEICGVTEETIRRDLDKLEAEGRLLRSHGGAVSVRDTQLETPYLERETSNVDQKMEIAQEAVKHILPGDRIVLDASSTAWFMTRILPDIPITVLTNSIKVALELSTKTKVEVISTGGILSPRSLSYVGPQAVKTLDTYHVDKAFISSKGVHIQRGISDSNELQAVVKQKMISITDKVFLLADYSKFNVQAFAKVSAWDDIDVVITDHQTEEAYIQGLKDTARSLTVIQTGSGK
ncbi:DeoR/GlpR family DNA-binding transcription regulator [Paenibacillus sp. J2TS4]|uniref:DeoR/GlpR family DNA-binding transcription regulator n=1 Tax=Paenibacillus sp. J2TS4 TaxID=2807194 RepID=UPI001B0C6F6A|nr:DeoR/GlpR family DNA-binding transcription regulator [Paenibacillus sp. J2TS4]GIP33561.1 putative HTH-type transcriptional regulator YulB [Paenibacillus sp. J2TS4]